MKFQKITDNILYCGLNDENRAIFDELIPLEHGTSYNSYIVQGSEKTAIIDTMYPPKTDEYLKNLDENGILGLIALINGNVQEAERAISKSANSENVKAALGALNIAKGNYAQAEKDFENVNSNTAALAQLLNKNYDAAAKTLNNVKDQNAMTDYLRAIVAARRGNKLEATSYLNEALKKDSSLKQYADNDLELSLLK